ncbi:MAG: SDR family NAD(P)-dependent oxidoreductase [Verrucomicrobia bacterium]|nr:SDR family NAD(P)-dependent oxidoreductase [Verrucomicrobiota bacterium]
MNRPDKTAIVTGATGAIGRAIARQLATSLDTAVVLVGRDERKVARATDEIRRETGNPDVCYELSDLARHESIRALCRRLEGPVHVLVNNAAVAPRTRQETPEGLEVQFATNVMSYVWMTLELREKLRAGAPSRIVNVASYWAGDLDIDDLQFKRRRYQNDPAYRQSKQANRMLTVAFAERLAADSIAVFACHPGDVNSRLSNDLGFGGAETPDQGASTPVWLATAEIGPERTGRYFEHESEVKCPFSRDRRAVEALFEACMAHAR